MLHVEHFVQLWQHHAQSQDNRADQVQVVGAEANLQDDQEDQPVDDTTEGNGD